jgi:adenylate cyclase
MKEIERKFLVKDDWGDRSNFVHIDQGYLSLDPDRTVRIRIQTNCQTSERIAFITIKNRNVGIVRDEFEYTIPAVDAEKMLVMCYGRISKYRYTINYQGKDWYIDQFLAGIDLILVEVELEDEHEKLEIPSWVGKDVSLNPKYYNTNIGRI